jgi:cell division protein FtsQ
VSATGLDEPMTADREAATSRRKTRAAGEPEPVARPRWLSLAIGLGVIVVLVVAPFLGGAMLRHMSFFRVRHVEVQGARYVSAAALAARLGVDTTSTVWQPLEPLEKRIAQDPQVRSVNIERDLPGTLVIRITERLPVAFIPSAEGLRAVDVDGRGLPIDPSVVPVDLPVLPRADSVLLHLLSDVHARNPELYARISEGRRVSRSELLLVIPPLTVRAGTDLTAGRLTDILPVESDLARRRARVAELDLRFRDQVIARLQ